MTTQKERYSEFIAIRVPPSVARELEQQAERQMIGVSTLVRQFIAEGLRLKSRPALLVDTKAEYQTE